MSSENIETIADLVEAVEHDLPESYIDYLQNYPDEVRDTVDEVTEEGISEMEILIDPAEIFQINQDVRNFSDGSWPENYFAIGCDGGGDYFAIDHAQKGSRVYKHMHETNEWVEEAASIKEFGEKCIEFYKMMNEEED